MKIKIELTSKELAVLHKNRSGEDQQDVAIEYEADITTESGTISKVEEHLVFGSALWALLVMLPHGLVKQYFLAWNDVVENISKQIDDQIKESLAKNHPAVDASEE